MYKKIIYKMSNIDEEDTTAVDQDKDNVLFRKLRKLINLITL